MLCSNVHLKDERKRKVVYRRHTDGNLEKEVRWVNWEGGVHDKKEGSRTEPCGTPQNRCGEKRNYFRIFNYIIIAESLQHNLVKGTGFKAFNDTSYVVWGCCVILVVLIQKCNNNQRQKTWLWLFCISGEKEHEYVPRSVLATFRTIAIARTHVYTHYPSSPSGLTWISHLSPWWQNGI